MGEIVNLRRARRALERREDEKRAQENRIRFGLSKAERKLAEKTNELAERRIDSCRLDKAPAPDSNDPQ